MRISVVPAVATMLLANEHIPERLTHFRVVTYPLEPPRHIWGCICGHMTKPSTFWKSIKRSSPAIEPMSSPNQNALDFIWSICERNEPRTPCGSSFDHSSAGPIKLRDFATRVALPTRNPCRNAFAYPTSILTTVSNLRRAFEIKLNRVFTELRIVNLPMPMI